MKKIGIIFSLLLSFLIFDLTNVKALEIHFDDLKISPHFEESRYEYLVLLENVEEQKLITIKSDDIVLASGDGPVLLHHNQIHTMVLMNSEGHVSVYNFTPVYNVAKLNNIEFEGIDFQFESDIFYYEINVPFQMNRITETVDANSGVSYRVNNQNLLPGENKIVITATEDGKNDSEYIFKINRSSIDEREKGGFDYTGEEQTFTAPEDGKYLLEVWGAQGAEKTVGRGGYGGYSSGVVELKTDEVLYINVGGQGAYRAGGYNGGGNGQYQAGGVKNAAGGGGGATHIAKISGLLSTLSNNLDDILIVAGGGGGASEASYAGGSGGGIQGNNGTGSCFIPKGGTQTTGGARGDSDATNGGFGYGGSAPNGSSTTGTYGAGGGGGGLYGGGGASFRSGSKCGASGAGGSGYIGNSLLTHKEMYCYNCTASSEESTKTITTTEVNKIATSRMVKSGNGFARITPIEKIEELQSITLNDGKIPLEFDPSIYEYNIIVENDLDQLKIDAFIDDIDIPIFGTGTFDVATGNNRFLINYVNAAQEVRIYVINVTREASSYKYLKGIKIDGVEIKDFDPKIMEYEVIVPAIFTKINIEPILGHKNQTVSGDGVIDFPGNTANAEILVISENREETSAYKLKFVREKSTKLRSLTVNSSFYSIPFNSSILEYDLEISHNVFSLPLTAIPCYEGATVTIIGDKYIEEDSTLITVRVDLEGIESTTYQIHLIRKDVGIGYIYETGYTGKIEEFVVPFSGLYKLEVWGAQGAEKSAGKGGYGAYSTGNIILAGDSTIYIGVGGQGRYRAGGFNGGGNGQYQAGGTTNAAGGGGGATHIAKKNGLLSALSNDINDILIVAAAGGGSSESNHAGGAGGGIQGNSGQGGCYIPTGGTQTTGGTRGDRDSGHGGFGYGGSAPHGTSSRGTYGAGGGGGGFYGGGGASYSSGNSCGSGGAGGSGYIGNNKLKDKVMYCYNCLDSSIKSAKTVSTMNVDSDPISEYAKKGNGYARLTYLSYVSANNYLDTMVLNDGNIELNFEPSTQEYNVYLPKDITKLKIDATVKDEKATIAGIGTFKTIPGEQKYEVIVTAEDESTRTYTLNVTREKSDYPYPDNIQITNFNQSLCSELNTYCQYNFEKDTALYEILVPFRMNRIDFKVDLNSEYQGLKIVKIVDGIEQETNEILGGINIFEITVTSENEKNSITYTYKINRDMTGNNYLQTLQTENPVIPFDFEPNVFEYFLEIDGNYTRYDVIATPQSENAKVKITGNEDLKVGLNNCIITVTAENGSTKVYMLHVYRSQDSNVFLESLKVKKGEEELELTPVFNKLLDEFTVNVENEVTEVTIEAIPENKEVTVTGAGTISLNTGLNKVELEVISSDKQTKKTYIVNVIRKKSSNADLKNITIDGYALDPIFDKDETEYFITVPKGVTQLNVNVEPLLDTTTYKMAGNLNLIKEKSEIVITSIAEDRTYKVYHIYVSKELNTNNNLSGLKVLKDEQELIYTPSFDKDTIEYNLVVDNDTNQIEIVANLEDSHAVITGNGLHSLNPGMNEIVIKVESESGEEKSYTIKIERLKNDDTTLKEVKNNRGSTVTKVEDSSLGYDYLINVQYEIPDIILEGIPNVSSSKVTGNGYYSLNIGNNDITLRVTSEAGNYKDYVVRVVRDLSTNDDLSFLFVEEGGLNPHFNETTIFYNVKVPNNVTEVHIEAIPEDKDATVDIVGDTTNLEVGVPREIQVVVTAPKGNQKTYTLSITRQEMAAENLALLKLETNRGELTPVFNPDTLNYTLEVENEITDITVTAEALSDTVQVLGTGTYDLRVGKNGISVFVVGTDEVQRDYQIVVTRKKSKDATLSSLVVKSHTLSPTFNKTTENYTLKTSGTYLDFTTIQPTESEATYVVTGNENFVTGENTVTIEVTAPDGETKKTYTLTVTKTGSKNNNLSSLAVEGYQMIPKFHKATTFYSLEIPNNLNSIVITATAEDPNATITGIGLQKIETGENYFEVVVTSEAGTEKKYTILVNKEASDNNYLGSLFLSEGELQPEFDKETISYGVTVPYTVSEITLTGSPEDSHATVTGLTTYPLQDGENNIVITVTSESGLVKTYTVKVTKEETISAYLIDLEAKGYELDTEFNKELFEYYITVGNEVTELDLSYTPEDKNATVNVTGNENFEIGMNEVHIEVTSSDGNLTEEYILYVNREFSTNNYLSSLSVDKGTLNPNFDPKTLTYNVEVERNIERINVSATTEDKSATIISGTGEHTLNLGNNLIQVKVRSSIGITRTYKINVLRKQDNDNYLSILVVSNKGEALALTPNFNKLTNEYTVSAGNDLNFIQIRAEAESEYATVVGSGTKEVKTGTNKYEITVTAEDGSTNTYVLNLTKEVSDNNYLSSLIPSVGTLDPEFNKETLEYTLKLGAEDTTLGFTVTPESNLSTVTGADTQTVSDGESVRLITVTAENGDVKTYKVKVQKETESEPRLEKLEILGYPFEFDPDTFEYHVQVSKSKKQLLESEITAIPKDSNATVNLMGDLNLIDGVTNTYIVEVIAKDGYTTQEYKIHITRDSLEYTIRSNVYDINRDGEVEHVIGMDPKTKKVDFLPNFENDPETLHIYGSDGVEITEEDKFIGSYMTIKLEIDGYTYDELVITVRGDLNGDGLVTAADNVQAKSYVLGKKQRTFLVTKIADINKDGLLTAPDVVRIKNYILGKRGLNE